MLLKHKRAYRTLGIVLVMIGLSGMASISWARWTENADARLEHHLHKTVESPTRRTSEEFRHIPKKPGHYAAEDWRAVIDSTWGEGLPTADKLAIFDTFWQTIDERFACFHNLDVNWDSLRAVYRPEIEAGVSRGRFATIMNHLSLALSEVHTFIVDVGVFYDVVEPGVPLLACPGWYESRHFGACLTPLPDSTLLVYRVVPDHPLGLQPGDLILGYDGVRWSMLYKELMEAQLPLTSWKGMASKHGTGGGGSCEESSTHARLISAGLNWHLFDTIDVVKFETGDTLHLPVSALVGQEVELYCTEQMPIPGVPFPDPDANIWNSWGMIEGTEIGYIYTWSWPVGSGNRFKYAIQKLMDTYDTKGLIIDTRVSEGGWPSESNKGLMILFSSDTYEIDDAERADLHDHYAMKPKVGKYYGVKFLGFDADPQFYDRPIAVLTGPGAVSNGEYMSLLLTFHPMSRHFGKRTNTAFSGLDFLDADILSENNWVASCSSINSYLLDQPGNYLAHVGFDIDEEIWLTQEDVAKGEDTVVKRAIEWIDSITATDIAEHESQLPMFCTLFQNHPNPFNPITTITYDLSEASDVRLTVYTITGQKVGVLVDAYQQPGHHTVFFDGSGYANGVYLYRLEAGRFVGTKRMVVLK